MCPTSACHSPPAATDMAQQGRAGVALFLTTIASFVGASLGIIILTAFSPMLSRVALYFGPADYFAMMVLGLVAAATLALARLYFWSVPSMWSHHRNEVE